jgi:adenylate cyclase
MFTDMVGYSLLGQRNESLSLALLEEQRRLLRPIFLRHNGRVVNTMGDSFLVEFPSALDAVRCAYDIQRATREFNISMPSEKRVHLRVGVHLGDVEASNGDVSGDAVNVASRIESLAEDGGVCLTRQVYDHVGNKFELQLVSLGSKSLKNVSAPLEVYKMVMPWDEEKAISSMQFDKKRVAVLPFSNISPDRADEYFADGMTEELISTLSRIGGLRVISRTSVMRYKGSGKGVEEIAKELNVGSILEGSVRKAHDDLRISAQLIDARNDEHLWSQDYDRKLEDVFAIQREIAQNVAGVLSVALLSSEKEDIERRVTDSPQAHTLYLKGRYYWNERTRDGIDKAVKYFEEAVRLDPMYALAYAGLADCYIIYGDYAWIEPKKAFPKAEEYASKSIEIDPRLAEPHASLGTAYTSYEWMWQEAEKEYRQAIGLKPSYATGHQWYGLYLDLMGRLDEANTQIKLASDLDPLSRIIGVNLADNMTRRGQYKEAIEQLDTVIEAYPDYANAHSYLGIALYFDSRTDEAIDELRKALVMSGGDANAKVDLAFFLGFSGGRDEASKLFEEIKGLSGTIYISKIAVAWVLFALGRVDEAFNQLDMACEEKSAAADHGNLLGFMRLYPMFSEMRTDPRWAHFERRLGLR